MQQIMFPQPEGHSDPNRPLPVQRPVHIKNRSPYQAPVHCPAFPVPEFLHLLRFLSPFSTSAGFRIILSPIFPVLQTFMLPVRRIGHFFHCIPFPFGVNCQYVSEGKPVFLRPDSILFSRQPLARAF
jgi:hypothetical protein